MSKSKSKTSKTQSTKAEPPVISKTKDMGVTKHSQAPKAKSKDLAKGVAEKLKSKKVKVPSPDPSDSEEHSEPDSPSSPSSASSEDEQSDSEIGTKAAASKAVPAAAARAKQALKSADSDDSDASADSSDSESESDSDEAKTANGAGDASDSDSDSDSDQDEDEKNIETLKSTRKTKNEEQQKKPVKSAMSSTNKKLDDDDGDASDSSDASSSDEEDEESEEEVVTKSILKRKADDESPFAAKKAKADRENGDDTTSKNLFVGQLAWGVTDDILAEAFQEYGELTRASVMMDKQTGRSRGFGYVEFANAKDAAKAQIAMHGAEIEGRGIKVDFSQPRQEGGSYQDKAQSRAKSFGDQQSPPSDTLFVGNIAFGADQDAITEAFTEHGTVMSVRLPTNQDTGAPKGFGYVTFASVEEAKTALEGAQGTYIAGRPIRLDFSTPRQNSDSSPRGGFSRGGFSGGGRGGRGRGGFGDRGGRGGFGDRGGRGGRGGPRGGRGGSTNRGGLGDFSGKKTTF